MKRNKILIFINALIPFVVMSMLFVDSQYVIRWISALIGIYGLINGVYDYVTKRNYKTFIVSIVAFIGFLEFSIWGNLTIISTAISWTVIVLIIYMGFKFYKKVLKGFGK